MTQLTLDIDPTPIFRVGCRVKGVIQQYMIEAVDHVQAYKFLSEDVPQANPILVLISK